MAHNDIMLKAIDLLYLVTTIGLKVTVQPRVQQNFKQVEITSIYS